MVGLTQSAVSRQIASMEEKLGVKLFERTTRSVRLTPAGADLAVRTQRLIHQTSDILRSVRETHLHLPETLRVGVERSIGLAYLPGFFFAFQKQRPEVQLHLQHDSEARLLNAIEEGELDAGLIPLPKALPKRLQAGYVFEDDFVMIFPRSFSEANGKSHMSLPEALDLTAGKRWLLLDEQGCTGRLLRHWLESSGWEGQPAMELDSFDTIAAMVALGLGVSLVPHRVLALSGTRRAVMRLPLRPHLRRTIAVITRKTARPRPVVSEFVKNVLF